MKIFLLNWRDPKNPESGGAEIVTFAHAKAWAKNGHEVIWLSSHFKGCSKKETLDNIKIVRYGSIFTIYFYAFFYYFLSGNKFDIVIDEIHGIPFFTPLYVRKPKIAFIHEVAGEIWDIMLPFPLNFIGRSIEKIYLRLYSNIPFWTDAESTIDELEKYGIKREKCIAIPCAINNKPLVKPPKKEENPTFIFVSRLVKMKGVEDVIKAFKIILEGEAKAQLWIVGGGKPSYIEFIKKALKNMGFEKKVKFWGRVNNIKKLELMARAHLLLHASVKEGWGLVVVEAASQYTPSIVYNVAGLRDSVKNGRTGIVVDENSPQRLAKEALALYKNKKKYEGLKQNGIIWAKSLNWAHLTKKSLALIEKYA